MKPFQTDRSMKHTLTFGFVVLAMVGFSGSPGEDLTPSAVSNREHNVMAVLWYQTAAEARALQYQAYNIARMMLERDLAQTTTEKKRAVIVDIDETILNNSRYEGRAIRINRGYPYEWDRWIDLAQAEAIPGSVDFLNYAVSKNVDVFYVTNRKERDRKGTLENLRRLGFPQADDEHLLTRREESSKETRRRRIAETHHVVLLIGDNLADFSHVFEKKTVQQRNEEVDRLRQEFGTRFIILPNPIYGDWEDALYDYQTGISDSVKNVRRKQALKGF
jgi:5'-nucleotidase (lipoprotein e(P4) family)